MVDANDSQWPKLYKGYAYIAIQIATQTKGQDETIRYCLVEADKYPRLYIVRQQELDALTKGLVTQILSPLYTANLELSRLPNPNNEIKASAKNMMSSFEKLKNNLGV